jgi:hypothetical protein
MKKKRARTRTPFLPKCSAPGVAGAAVTAGTISRVVRVTQKGCVLGQVKRVSGLEGWSFRIIPACR